MCDDDHFTKRTTIGRGRSTRIKDIESGQMM